MSMANVIHPTAVISKSVSLEGDNIQIGPYCVLEGKIKIRSNTVLLSHVSIRNNTQIGQNNVFHPFSSIGNVPQDLKYKGEESRLEIGDNNVFREGVTVNIGTENGGMLTKIGNNNLLMANSHVGHDAKIGNHCILANCVAVAGHVHMDDNVLVGGNSAIHQHVKIGRLAVVGGMSGITGDLPPFALAYGDRALIRSINLVGLKRSKFSKEDMMTILKAYRILFSSSGTFNERLELLKETFGENEFVKEIVEFVNNASSRTISQGKLDEKLTD